MVKDCLSFYNSNIKGSTVRKSAEDTGCAVLLFEGGWREGLKIRKKEEQEGEP